MSEEIFYAFIDSDMLGKTGIASSRAGIVLVQINTKENLFLDTLKKKFDSTPIKSEKINARAVKELKAYLKGKSKKFESRLDIRGTHFQKRVLEAARKIPYGTTCSYKSLACKAGR